MEKIHQQGYDVVVVGGRVAGSVVAALLGDRGASVLLVERVSFPRPTISTHFFRGAGLVSVLDRLGVLDEVLALQPPKLRGEWTYGFGSPGPDRGETQEPGQAGYALSVRRAPLDDLLLERARRSPGVVVAQPCTVTSLVLDGPRVIGVRMARGEQTVEVRSRIVVGADGRRSLVARQVAAGVQRETEPLRTLYYRYVSDWRGPDGALPTSPEFSLNGDELAYVFPSDGGTTCLALSAPSAAFGDFRRAPEAELYRRLGAHPGLARRVAAATAAGKVMGGSPEPNWIRQAAGPGWALVGDAGVHQDPWTGEGMDNASLTAALAADILGEWLCSHITEDEAISRYQAARDARVAGRFDECTTLARDLSQLASA